MKPQKKKFEALGTSSSQELTYSTMIKVSEGKIKYHPYNQFEENLPVSLAYTV